MEYQGGAGDDRGVVERSEGRVDDGELGIAFKGARTDGKVGGAEIEEDTKDMEGQ